MPLITNVMGSSAAELSGLVEACQGRPEISALELNLSCPNVSTGLDIGADPAQLAEVVGEVRRCTSKPLVVKLTPNTADVALCAQAAEDAGADAVSLINTLRAGALAPGRAPGSGERWLGGGTGGLSGPAVRVVALAQVAAVAERVAIPVVGMGGVQQPPCARSARCGGHARRRGDRELPRPRRRGPHRARAGDRSGGHVIGATRRDSRRFAANCGERARI